MRKPQIIESIQKKIFDLTPIGSTDNEIRSRLESEEVDLKEYDNKLQNYRLSLLAFNASRALLYASLISSVATTFNIYGLGIIESVATYIGASVTFLLYVITRHIASRRKELYRLEREILAQHVE